MAKLPYYLKQNKKIILSLIILYVYFNRKNLRDYKMDIVDLNDNDIDDERRKRKICLLICLVLILVMMVPSTIVLLATF